MAQRRVFNIAKELGVKSKAIVEKCEHEGVPGITNHMSTVSAGLEATIREWFTAEESGEESHTAVETTEKVDLEKAKAKPRKRAAKKAASKKADTVTDTGGDTATAVAEPPQASTVAPSVAPAPTQPEDDQPEPVVAPEPKPEPKPIQLKPVQAAPAAAAPEATAASPAAPKADDSTEGSAPSPAAPEAPKPTPTTPDLPPPPVVTPNVPTRPKVVAPAGQPLELQKKKPATLSGPKVVRVEQPDVVDSPRRREPREDDGGGIANSRGPRGGGGVGPMGGGPMDGGDGRGARNKRRSGGRDGGAGGGRRGRGGDEGGRWRSQDLLEREQRLNRSEGFLRQRRRDQKLKSGQSVERAKSAAQTGGKVKIESPFTIKTLSAVTGVKAADIVKKLFMEGEMATVNSPIEDEKAQEIMIEWDIELEIVTEAVGEAAVQEQFEQREMVNEGPRRPVVTILGHVDHGKTSLLDYIRKANVASGEAGGITQATSAFVVDVPSGDGEKQVCFLDTPGHEAFTEMRARGATMTDIVVLVVAADDGVMPQTIESINHAKAAGVPIIVALNKIDLAGASEETNIQRIYGQLTEHELSPTEWGGEIEVIKTSSHTGQGIDELLETLDLTAQIHEFKADFGGNASGVVVEAKTEEGRGAVANILVQQGELKVGDFIVAGRAFGRLRDMTNDRGERIKVAGPSTPVQISGIDEIPDAGDKFYIVKTLKMAQEAAEQRRHDERQKQLSQPKVTLDSMFAQMTAVEKKEVLVVLKADVQGSIDAIVGSITDIESDEVSVRVLHSAVGGVTESDVTLAGASGAIIMGFNVIPSAAARKSAEAKGVEIRSYRVIYDIVDDVKAAAEGLLTPELREEVIGHAEVREVFKITKVGAIAGCYVTDGTIERNALIRVTRDDIVIEQDRVLEQLKRFKEDAKEVKSGLECGMKIAGYDDIKAGDILECFKKIEVKRTL